MDEAKELFDQVYDDFNSAIKSDENEDKQFFHFAQMLDRLSDVMKKIMYQNMISMKNIYWTKNIVIWKNHR